LTSAPALKVGSWNSSDDDDAAASSAAAASTNNEEEEAESALSFPKSAIEIEVKKQRDANAG
jgi:hypothetical protein